VGESCDHYAVVSGGGAYGLLAGASRTVTVRFTAPATAGPYGCQVGTGSTLCSNVSCTATVVEPPQPVFVGAFSYPTAQVDQWTGANDIRCTVRNDGAPADTGRIVFSFPGLTAPGDTARVRYSWADGGRVGYAEHAPGSNWHNAACGTTTLGHVFLELRRLNWAPENEVELYIQVRPKEAGSFPILVRSTMHVPGGDCALNVNGVPAAGTPETDALGFPVKQYRMNVLP